MNEDQVKGGWLRLRGRIREFFGRHSGDGSQQFRGKMERGAGNVQEGYGDLKDKLRRDTDERRPDDYLG